MTIPQHIISMGFTKEKFPAGTHMCMIYDNEEERRKYIFQFLEEGLKSGEKVYYFTDTMPTDGLKQAFMKFIGNGDKHYDLMQNLEIWPTSKAYYPNGRFSPDEMLDRWRSLWELNKKGDFTNLRVTGETGWTRTQGVPGAEAFIEYECRLNDIMETHPFPPICQYDARLFDGEAIFDILKVHPKVIMHGMIVSNPFYTSTGEFMKEYAGRKAAARTC